MSQSDSAAAAPACSPDFPPLFAMLCEEAKRHQVAIDLSDRKLVDKINALAKRVPREYEIVQAFRAFLEDPNHPAVFFFPDRYDRLRKASQVIDLPKTGQGPGYDYAADDRRPVTPTEILAQQDTAFSREMLRQRRQSPQAPRVKRVVATEKSAILDDVVVYENPRWEEARRQAHQQLESIRSHAMAELLAPNEAAPDPQPEIL